MQIKIKFAGKMRSVEVSDKDCATRPCLKPHDCPAQGGGGVRSSQPRWMCLTNVNHGCPDPKPEPGSKGADEPHGRGEGDG